MKITYKLENKDYSFDQHDENEISKLNFLLTNSKGDFLQNGIGRNPSKFFGYNYCNPKTLEIFKILDEIILEDFEANEVIFDGSKIIRKFSSSLLMENDDSNQVISDSFFIGPTGGFIYEINNYEGNIFIDLDARSQFDFDEWGRDYKIYKEGKNLVVEYTKNEGDKEKYKLFLVIKTQNFSYKEVNKWINKNYKYSQLRNSKSNLYIFRALEIDVNGNKKIFFGASDSKADAIAQIDLLEKHEEELIGFEKELFNELTNSKHFEKPLSEDLDLAYRLSNNAIHNFYNKNFDKGDLNSGLFAGFPWFSKIWARDELVGLRAFINNEEYFIVKERLFYYLNSIDLDDGLIKRIDEKGSLGSCDGIFWIAKRIGDLIFKLESTNRFKEIFDEKDIKLIYQKLNVSFLRIVGNQWNKDEELLEVKNGDSWMDTIQAQFPLDIQVQFCEFSSMLAELAGILGLKKDASYFLDFENGLRENIRSKYFRDNQLFNEAFSDDLRSNIFLAYYFYPQLFLKNEWEIVIDNALSKLRTSWGGISSLSKSDRRFLENYTGEKNESYHNGDSWYWINNIAAIVLNDLNEKKYRDDIRNILLSSTKDILKFGTVGYGSEISSASYQKAEGNLAQLWSSSTYLEMIDSLFKRI